MRGSLLLHATQPAHMPRAACLTCPISKHAWDELCPISFSTEGRANSELPWSEGATRAGAPWCIALFPWPSFDKEASLVSTKEENSHLVIIKLNQSLSSRSKVVWNHLAISSILMKAALQHCNLGANVLHVAHKKIALTQLTGTQLRLTHLQANRNLHKGIRSNTGGSPRACCSLSPSSKDRNTIRDKASILRRAVLGGILLSAGAMPFTSRRFSSASAADLTADKVGIDILSPDE